MKTKTSSNPALVQRSIIGSWPIFFMMSLLAVALIWGIPGIVIYGPLGAIALTLLFIKAAKREKEQAVRISEYLTKNYNLSVVPQDVNRSLGSLSLTSRTIQVRAHDLNSCQDRVVSLKFSEDFTQVVPSIVYYHSMNQK